MMPFNHQIYICLFNFFLSVFYSIQCTSFTTLLKSVPKHFIRFVAIMIFLIFFSNSLFFAYRNVADFCMLTLYPQFYWIHLLVLTGFVELLRFSICMIMLTSNTNNLTSSFVFWMPFTFFFLFSLLWLGLLVLCWVEVVRLGTHALYRTDYDDRCGFFMYDLYCAEVSFLYGLP